MPARRAAARVPSLLTVGKRGSSEHAGCRAIRAVGQWTLRAAARPAARPQATEDRSISRSTGRHVRMKVPTEDVRVARRRCARGAVAALAAGPLAGVLSIAEEG